MAKAFLFLFNIIFYLVGVGGLFYIILWMGNLLPFHPIDKEVTTGTAQALLTNIGLIVLWSLQHTIMARQGFKSAWTKIIPESLERSVYVLISGLLGFLIAWQWLPIEGSIWNFESGTTAYYIMYGIYFVGILFLLSSSFLINHFELFGLQQGFFHMQGKETEGPKFKEAFYYKIIRHPIYLGFLLIFWFTPSMTATHFVLSLLFTIYILIGVRYEEKDLITVFGDKYEEYKKRVPQLIPFTKFK